MYNVRLWRVLCIENDNADILCRSLALSIFQCTMCVLFTQFLPLLRGFYCLTGSLFIISHFRAFVKYFFKTFLSFFRFSLTFLSLLSELDYYITFA